MKQHKTNTSSSVKLHTLKQNTKKISTSPWPNFIFKDLPSVLIHIIADHISNDSLCCSYKYN